MVLTTTLLAALALGAVDGPASRVESDGRGEADGRGAVGTSPEEAVAARPAARMHLTISGVAAFATAMSAQSGGGGASGDLGAVIDDRFSFFAHVSAVTLGLSFAGHFGAMLEYHFGERFSAAVGVAYGSWIMFYPIGNGSWWSGLLFPVRVSLNLSSRAPTHVSRAGAFVALELSPGLSTQDNRFNHFARPLPPEFGLSVALSIGFAMR